jgi:hypothetical protein
VSVQEEKMEVENEEPIVESVTEEKPSDPISVQENVVIEEKEKPSASMLHELYKDDPSVTGRSRQLRCKCFLKV